MDTAVRSDIASVDAEALNELHRLSDEIADRQSIRYLSRALMCGFIGMIGLGLSIKLLRDSEGFPVWACLAATADSAAWLVAISSAWKGRRFLRDEAAVFEQLRRAQERLGISRNVP